MSIKEMFDEFVKEENAIEKQDGYELSNGILVRYRGKNDSIEFEKINKEGNKVGYSVFDAVKDGVSDRGFYLNVQDKNGDYYVKNSHKELVEIFNKIC